MVDIKEVIAVEEEAPAAEEVVVAEMVIGLALTQGSYCINLRYV